MRFAGTVIFVVAAPEERTVTETRKVPSGPVRVTGSDIYDLDRDGDGIACDT